MASATATVSAARVLLSVVILCKDRDGFGDCLGLRSASLAPLLPLCVQIIASGLQVLKELDVRCALLSSEVQILFGIGQCLAVSCILRLHLIQLLLASGDFLLFRCSQGLVILLSLQLIFLTLGKISLELFQHLVHDAINSS